MNGDALLMREEGWLPSVGPDIEVPGWHPPIRALAEQKGSTKSHAEARLLVAALEAP